MQEYDRWRFDDRVGKSHGIRNAHFDKIRPRWRRDAPGVHARRPQGLRPGMWRASLVPLADNSGIHVSIGSGAAPLAFDHAVRAWQEDPAFRAYTSGLLADMPFMAFRWETPPWFQDARQRPFEFVVLDCPELDRPADPAAFAAHFADGDSSPVRSIHNLGGDARLVVPRPLGAHHHYAHLGAFVRGAPESQQQALWRSVGDSLMAEGGPAPVWLSTAGLGVPWLHVRIDRRPKYYGHAAYRDAAAS